MAEERGREGEDRGGEEMRGEERSGGEDSWQHLNGKVRQFS